jgi:hypothetical protein
MSKSSTSAFVLLTHQSHSQFLALRESPALSLRYKTTRSFLYQASLVRHVRTLDTKTVTTTLSI